MDLVHFHFVGNLNGYRLKQRMLLCRQREPAPLDVPVTVHAHETTCPECQKTPYFKARAKEQAELLRFGQTDRLYLQERQQKTYLFRGWLQTITSHPWGHASQLVCIRDILAGGGNQAPYIAHHLWMRVPTTLRLPPRSQLPVFSVVEALGVCHPYTKKGHQMDYTVYPLTLTILSPPLQATYYQILIERFALLGNEDAEYKARAILALLETRAS